MFSETSSVGPFGLTRIELPVAVQNVSTLAIEIAFCKLLCASASQSHHAISTKKCSLIKAAKVPLVVAISRTCAKKAAKVPLVVASHAPAAPPGTPTDLTLPISPFCRRAARDFTAESRASLMRGLTFASNHLSTTCRLKWRILLQL